MTSGKKYLTSQKYFKPNYFEALKFIIPEYLTQDDIDNFGRDVDLKDQVINSNIKLANEFNSLVSVSAVADTIFSSINTVSGISEYFVKQNDLTNITTREFDEKILNPLGFTITDFETSSAFANYVSATLLPSIVLNKPTATFVEGHQPSDTHNYLISNLSWAYILNTSGPNEIFDPSTAVTNRLVETIYKGQSFLTVDGIKVLTDFIWNDNHREYYPSVFVPSTTTFTSGTQQLDNLKTWVDVIYSPLNADKADFTVRNRFEQFMENNLLTENKIPNGPFTKFLRAISFLAQDINNTSESLSDLYDISECPDEFLPLLADLIGWDLFGTDPKRWRLQLRNAVDIYRTVGTKKAIQLAVDCILPKEQFGINTFVSELHESYIPFLIYYSLATNSKFFESLLTYPQSFADSMGVSGYSMTSIDENIKLTVDKILLDTYDRFRDKFGPLANQEKGYNYRGRVYPIPPFEEYPYYVNLELDKFVVEFIKDRLLCFGCTRDFADKFESYIEDNCLNVDNQPRTNSFLFFTSGYNDPPNLEDLIASGYNEKFEYASLWSGKSSHFRITLDASSFNFNDQSMDSSSTGGSFLVVSKLAKDFVPAHSIPLINLEINYLNDLGLVASSLPLIRPLCNEQEANSGRNFFTSGVGFNTYMRDVRTGGAEIGKNFLNNVDSPSVLAGTNVIDIPRTSVRRRNYEKLLPNDGYYDRTGFNMPISFDMASGVSGLPLGLIPSSLQYASVTDHVNLPAVWGSCEGFNSGNTYFGFDVSNTLNTRGASGAFTSNIDRTVDRGQLPDIQATMHAVKERVKLLEASAIFGAASPYELSVSNVYQSYANLITETSGAFPDSYQDFCNFSFGRDLHKLYRIYTEDYNQHQLKDKIIKDDGANIFSHTFGPTLFNHDFEDVSDGSIESPTPQIVSFSKAVADDSTKDMTISKPTGVEAGDLLIVLAGQNKKNSTTPQYNADLPGATWNRIINLGDDTHGVDNNMHLGGWYRVADGSETSTQTIIGDSTGAEQWSLYLRVTGASQTDPINAIGTPDFHDAKALKTAQPTTASRKNCLALAVHSQESADNRLIGNNGSQFWRGDRKIRFLDDAERAGTTVGHITGPDRFHVSPPTSNGAWTQFDLQGTPDTGLTDKFFSSPSGVDSNNNNQMVAALSQKIMTGAGTTGARPYFAKGDAFAGFQFVINPDFKSDISPTRTFPELTTSSFAVSSSTDTITLEKPAGVQAGDLLLITAAAGHDSFTSVGEHFTTSPTGWTRIINNQPSTGFDGGLKSCTWFRIADGTENSSEDIVAAATSPHAVGVYYRITGASQTDPIGTIGSNVQEINIDDRERTIPSIATTSNNSLALGIGISQAKDAFEGTIRNEYETYRATGPNNGQGWQPAAFFASPSSTTLDHDGVSILNAQKIMLSPTGTGDLEFLQIDENNFLGNCIEIKSANTAEETDQSVSFLTSSLSSSPVMGPRSAAFLSKLSFAASGPNDMQVDTSERVLSGAINAIELIHTSGSPDTNVFSIFRIPSSFKSSADDPFMFDNTFVSSRSTTGGLPRVRFNLSKYEATGTPIATNFLLPDHSYKASVTF